MSPIELYAYRRAMHNGLPHTVPMTPMEWLGVSEEWYRLGDHWETGSESESGSMSTTCSDLDGWEIVEPMSEVAIPLGMIENCPPWGGHKQPPLSYKPQTLFEHVFPE